MATTVLVVDDDQDFLEMLDAVLTPQGYAVAQCPDPTAAHQKARELHPRVIIVDYVMPVFSGTQVVEELKADPATAHIPVIVCTAAIHDMEYLRKLGCEILPKPFEVDDLLALLAEARRKAG